MSHDCILALDQGTTSSRALVVDAARRIVADQRCPVPQHFPQPGWVEHDLEEIWAGVVRVAQGAIGQLEGGWGRIAAIGVANQRETVGLWERGSGKPVARAIVWQCRRTAGRCEALQARCGERISELTGLTVDPYFSATKLGWLLDNVPGARDGSAELAGGTVDTWLVWRLTGGAHLTEPTNASRTMLFDIGRLAWSEELLEVFGVPECVLPRVIGSGADFGLTCGTDGIPAGIPIRAALGDQQAALFGQACVAPGQAKNTYGTGCFLLANTGAEQKRSWAGLLTTVGCDAQGGPCYALEGSVFIAGAAVQWLRDGLGIIGSSREVEALARSVPDTAGVQFVPAFVGLGAPHWDPPARGAILGLTRGAGRAHLARAALEAIAQQTADVLEAMHADGTEVRELKVDGGAAENDLLLQLQADLADVAVVRPASLEMTALGAAYLAGMGAGLWDNPWELGVGLATRFGPQIGEGERRERREAWQQAVRRVRTA